MTRNDDVRSSARIPITRWVQVIGKGRAASYALAINISMGGLLLGAGPALPVGSTLKLAIPSGDGEKKNLMVEGLIIRTDTNGTAVKFLNQLEYKAYETFSNLRSGSLGQGLVRSYTNYFKVSQNRNYEGCEQLFGVSTQTFRRILVATFSASVPLAVLPVWGLKASIQAVPVWMKIVACFGYAALWFALIQPFMDLALLRISRSRNAKAVVP